MGNLTKFREIRWAPFRPRAHMQNLKSNTVHTPLCGPEFDCLRYSQRSAPFWGAYVAIGS